MKYILIMFLLVGFLFADENVFKLGETLSFSASAATDADTTGAITISHWKGTVVLGVDPVLDTGTAQDITITFQHRFTGMDYNGTDLTVGTLTAANITAGQTVYYDITALSDFIFADDYQFVFAGASGTYTATLTVQVKGQ